MLNSEDLTEYFTSYTTNNVENDEPAFKKRRDIEDR